MSGYRIRDEIKETGVTGIERSREGGSWPRIVEDGALRWRGRKVSWLAENGEFGAVRVGKIKERRGAESRGQLLGEEVKIKGRDFIFGRGRRVREIDFNFLFKPK